MSGAGYGHEQQVLSFMKSKVYPETDRQGMVSGGPFYLTGNWARR
jgi:hypothetical protein